MFYAVARHGAAGLGQSYGYAEVIEGEPPRSDMTTTVVGPFSQAQAQTEADRMNAECDKFRSEQDG